MQMRLLTPSIVTEKKRERKTKEGKNEYAMLINFKMLLNDSLDKAAFLSFFAIITRFLFCGTLSIQSHVSEDSYIFYILLHKGFSAIK